jgi:hypothetical protein
MPRKQSSDRQYRNFTPMTAALTADQVKTLRKLAELRKTSQQALLREAVDDLIAKYRR